MQRLPKPTSSLLSSTQIITDPCSVVKELVENSFDAGARSISVDCSPNCLDVIQVRDDGCGVGPAASDRRVMVSRGWTSKFGGQLAGRIAEDLGSGGKERGESGPGAEGNGGRHGEGKKEYGARAATLGFRGEALASIADLSDGLYVVTRTEGEEDVGVKIGFGKDGKVLR